MLYIAKNVTLSCTTYSVCPKNLRKECPFSRLPAGLCMSPNRMRVYVSQLVYPKNLLIYQLRLADASAICMQHTPSHDWLSATTKLISCFCVKTKASLSIRSLYYVRADRHCPPKQATERRELKPRGSRKLQKWDKQTTGKMRRKKKEILPRMLPYN